MAMALALPMVMGISRWASASPVYPSPSASPPPLLGLPVALLEVKLDSITCSASPILRATADSSHNASPAFLPTFPFSMLSFSISASTARFTRCLAFLLLALRNALRCRLNLRSHVQVMPRRPRPVRQGARVLLHLKDNALLADTGRRLFT